MINPYRPVPSLPPPPPPPPPAPVAAPLPMQAQPPLYQQYPQPVRAQQLNWDPLGELAFSAVGTPLAALAGAAVGFLVAGPIGAARGAMIGASLPGATFVGYELFMKTPWGGQPNRNTGWLAIGVLAAFPLLSAVGFGIGMATAGAAAAAWGTVIAAALPIAAVMGAGFYQRWINPPTYDPNPMPAPTAPTRPRV